MPGSALVGTTMQFNFVTSLFIHVVRQLINLSFNLLVNVGLHAKTVLEVSFNVIVTRRIDCITLVAIFITLLVKIIRL